jgi:hypothetical protein
MRTILTLLTCVIFAGCVAVGESTDPIDRVSQKSKNLAADRRLMWKTAPLSGYGPASTDEATEAALRVFNTVELVGKTRDEIIASLGDPKTSSRSVYNFPFYPAPRGTMVYRFDTGSGGWQFNLLFNRHGKVRKIEKLGIE